MKQFCVGFVSLFDNVMRLEIQSAPDALSALRMCPLTKDLSKEQDNVEGVFQAAFDADLVVGIIEIPAL
jgi:hypothetical protein